MAVEPIDRQATAAIIASTIRARILDGTFAPGMQLGEAQLAERLQVSRGPVREAMQRLIQEGLLRGERHRGVFVISPGPSDVEDIYRARGAVEREAALAVVRSRPPAVLDRLREIVTEMGSAARTGEWMSVARLDLAFHETLVEGSGSPRLVRMFRTLAAETQVCLNALEGAYPTRRPLVAEHRRLLRALIAGEEEHVTAKLEEHFSHAVRHLSDAIPPTS